MRTAALVALLAALTAQGMTIPTSEQMVMGNKPQVPQGFNIDLSQRRLVQFSEGPAVWMTELEKVSMSCVRCMFGRPLTRTGRSKQRLLGRSSLTCEAKPLPGTNFHVLSCTV